MMIQNRLRTLHTDNRGMTLLEVLVAMGIFSILLTLVVSMFVTGSRMFSQERGTVQNSQVASTTMNEVTRVIRAGTDLPVYGSSVAAPVLRYAGAESLTITSLIDMGTAAGAPPVQASFARNGSNQLVQTRWTAYSNRPGYWLFPSASSSSRILVATLEPASTDKPLFRYYSGDNTEIVPPKGGTLTADQIRTVASIRVTLRVLAAPGAGTGTVELRNTVGLPNLGVTRVEVAGS